MSKEIIKDSIRRLPLKEAKEYSEELVFWNRIAERIETDEIDVLAVGKISAYNKLKRWRGMFLLTNKNIFLIPENKKIEIIKIKISIIEKFVVKKGLLNKININECGFNFQKKEDEILAIKQIDQMTDVRIKRDNFIPIWICACYFISVIIGLSGDLTVYDEQDLIFIIGYFALPIYLTIETYLNEFERGKSIFICLLKGIICGFLLFFVGTFFLVLLNGYLS